MWVPEESGVGHDLSAKRLAESCLQLRETPRELEASSSARTSVLPDFFVVDRAGRGHLHEGQGNLSPCIQQAGQ